MINNICPKLPVVLCAKERGHVGLRSAWGLRNVFGTRKTREVTAPGG